MKRIGATPNNINEKHLKELAESVYRELKDDYGEFMARKVEMEIRELI